MIATLLIFAAATSPTAEPVFLGPTLWRELRLGMTPEQAANELRKVEGISEVAIKSLSAMCRWR
jgi:hypothetical protein